jgi:hypothetical protein
MTNPRTRIISLSYSRAISALLSPYCFDSEPLIDNKKGDVFYGFAYGFIAVS